MIIEFLTQLEDFFIELMTKILIPLHQKCRSESDPKLDQKLDQNFDQNRIQDLIKNLIRILIKI